MPALGDGRRRVARKGTHFASWPCYVCFSQGWILISVQLCLSALLSYLQRFMEDLLCARRYPKCLTCLTTLDLTLTSLFFLWEALVYTGTNFRKYMKLDGKASFFSNAHPSTAWPSHQGIPLWWPFWGQFSVLWWEDLWSQRRFDLC